MPRKFDFWSRVEKTDSCWIWTGAKENGYGLTYPGNRKTLAHRWVWTQLYGETEDAIYQTCENKLCVNPEHLEVASVENRLWGSVQRGGDDECWEWQGFKDENGYGRISIKNVPTLVHRVAYELLVGPIPDGLNLLHRCDNPPCVNPNHLVPGTQADNIHDMIDKGRGRMGVNPNPRRGVDHHNTKIKNEAYVIWLRKRHHEGASFAQLSRETGINHETIRDAVLGITWSHVRDDGNMLKAAQNREGVDVLLSTPSFHL